jgi:hypothetical protein
MRARIGGNTLPSVRLIQHADRVDEGTDYDTQIMVAINGSTSADGHTVLLQDNVEDVTIDNLNHTYYLFAYLVNGGKLESVKIFFTMN